MPPKKSNLNNASSKGLRRKRVERTQQLPQQIETRNAAQRITTAESRAQESQEQRDERLQHNIKRTRAARERNIATVRVLDRQRQRISRSLTRASFNIKYSVDFDPVIPEDERRFYLKAYQNVNHVRERKVHCTVCKMHIGTAPSNESIIRMHPILRVTHCKKCHEFYNSGEFSKGEDGSELYCRWCGQGGEVYCCSNCPFVFCKSCIISNLSRGVVADIEQNENWSCFNCAPKMLWPLRAQHWALIKFIDKQKRAILNSSLSDAEIKTQMTKDRSLCCKIKKASGYGTDSSESSDISLSRLKQKAGEKRSRKSLSKEDLSIGSSPAQAKKVKSNDEVVCTPDVMSMLEPECTLTVPSNAKQNPQPLASTPKIMSIPQPAKRINTPPLLIRNNQSPNLRPLAPTPVLKKTVVGPRLPSGQGSDFSTPVYHTINGYRIDLNSAAQQETVRLPNGKLIQVKRQGTGPQTVTTVQNAAPPQHSTPARIVHNATVPALSPISNVPAQQIVHSSGGHIIRAQLQTPRSVAIQNPAIINQYQQPPPPIAQQQYQQITIRQPNQQIATIRYQGNPTQQMTNMIQNGTMQLLNGTQVTTPGGQLANIRPMPTFVKQFFPNTALGQSRTQLQNQIFSAMEICQHLMGKVQTLTNSNAYKTAKSMTDVKELYIHLSYLLTYAIGRFKGLQDSCLSDMRDLGFTNDANSLENGQLAAGTDMVRSGMITDFENVDLDSFHALIVQNMSLMTTAAADSSTNTDGKINFQVNDLVNEPDVILGTGDPASVVEIDEDDDEDNLLVEIAKTSPEPFVEPSNEDSESETDEGLLMELGDRNSNNEEDPDDNYVHPGLVTSYEKDDDYTERAAGGFTKNLDIELIELVKGYPELWNPKRSKTNHTVLREIWEYIDQQMPEKQASDAEEDEITIVEPKTDTINLDSDNEDELPPPAQIKSNGKAISQSVIQNHVNITTPNPPVLNIMEQTPIVTPTTTTNADDELTAEYDFSKVASLLAGMLEVELTEGNVESIQVPKKPRKKTTNKPNPTLLKQKEIQERERLENIKKNCAKLKMQVQIPLNKVEEIYEYAKPMVEELKLEAIKAQKIEDEEKDSAKEEISIQLSEKEKKEEIDADDIQLANPVIEKSEKDSKTEVKDDSDEVVVVLVEDLENSKEEEETDKNDTTNEKSVEILDNDESHDDQIQQEDLRDLTQPIHKSKDGEDTEVTKEDTKEEELPGDDNEDEAVVYITEDNEEQVKEPEPFLVNKNNSNSEATEVSKKADGKIDSNSDVFHESTEDESNLLVPMEATEITENKNLESKKLGKNIDDKDVEEILESGSLSHNMIKTIVDRAEVV